MTTHPCFPGPSTLPGSTPLTRWEPRWSRSKPPTWTPLEPRTPRWPTTWPPAADRTSGPTSRSRKRRGRWKRCPAWDATGGDARHPDPETGAWSASGIPAPHAGWPSKPKIQVTPYTQQALFCAFRGKLDFAENSIFPLRNSIFLANLCKFYN